MAAPVTFSGSWTAFPKSPGGASTDNLNALASAAAKPLGCLDLSAAIPADVNIGPVKLQANAAGVSASGTASLYLITGGSVGTAADWTDTIDPESTSDIASSIRNARLIQRIDLNANGAIRTFEEFSLMAVLGFIPKFSTLVVLNSSGAALAASTHSAKYQLVGYV